MSEDRLERLEDKVDGIKEDVSELKTDLKVHMNKVDTEMKVFAEHITGDNKIISHLQPLLDDIPLIKETLEEFRYEKKAKAKLMEKLKFTSAILGITSLSIGIYLGIGKLF